MSNLKKFAGSLVKIFQNETFKVDCYNICYPSELVQCISIFSAMMSFINFIYVLILALHFLA